MVNYDLPNLLCMFDESLAKLIRHLEDGNPEKALMRAKEMRGAIKKLKTFCGWCEEKIISQI